MARPKDFISEMPSQLSDLLQPGSDQDRHRKYFSEGSTKAIRSLLVQLLDKKYELSVRKSDDSRNLLVPGYAEHQAYQSGYRSALKELSTLLDTTDQ